LRESEIGIPLAVAFLRDLPLGEDWFILFSAGANCGYLAPLSEFLATVVGMLV
jgi:hypothetical protein